jgi:hypothetical protein
MEVLAGNHYQMVAHMGLVVRKDRNVERMGCIDLLKLRKLDWVHSFVGNIEERSKLRSLVDSVVDTGYILELRKFHCSYCFQSFQTELVACIVADHLNRNIDLDLSHCEKEKFLVNRRFFFS